MNNGEPEWVAAAIKKRCNEETPPVPCRYPACTCATAGRQIPGKPVADFRAGIRVGLDTGITQIRADCMACHGSGYSASGDGTECEYCGRPMQSLRALHEQVKP